MSASSPRGVMIPLEIEIKKDRKLLKNEYNTILLFYPLYTYYCKCKEAKNNQTVKRMSII